MTLPAEPNPISMSQINVELGFASNARISLNDTAVRTLLGKLSGTISMREAYNQSQSLPTPVVTYVSGVGSITFSWAAIAGARYWYYLDGSNSPQEAYTNSLLISGLGNNVSKTLSVYYSKVGFTNSSASTPITGVTQSVLTINNLAVQSGFGSLTFSWTTDAGVSYTGYFDGGAVTSVSSPITYSNLSQTSHTFTLNAFKAGSVPVSSSISGTPILSKLATPIFTSATSTETSVSFAWNPVAYATNYDVTLSGSTINTITYNQTGTSFTSFGSLVYGTYTISVIAKANGAISSNAATSSVTTVATAPTSISLLVEPTSTNVKVTVSTTGATAVSYKLTKYTDNTYTTILGNPISQVSNVFNIAGTVYTTVYFKVEAYGSSGQSISTLNSAIYADAVGKPVLSMSNMTNVPTFRITMTATNATDFYLYQIINGGYYPVVNNKTGIFDLSSTFDKYLDFIGYAANLGASSGWSDVLSFKTPADPIVESITVTVSDLLSTSAKFTINYTGRKTPSAYVIELYTADDLGVPKQSSGVVYSNPVSMSNINSNTKYYIKAWVYGGQSAGWYISPISEANSFTTPVYVPPVTAPSTLQLYVISYDYVNSLTTVKFTTGTGGIPTTYYLWRSADSSYNGLNSPIANTTGEFTLPMGTGWLTGYGSNSAGTSPYFSNLVNI